MSQKEINYKNGKFYVQKYHILDCGGDIIHFVFKILDGEEEIPRTSFLHLTWGDYVFALFDGGDYMKFYKGIKL